MLLSAALLGGASGLITTLIGRPCKQWKAWRSWAATETWKRFVIALPIVAAALGATISVIAAAVTATVVEANSLGSTTLGVAAGAGASRSIASWLTSLPRRAAAKSKGVAGTIVGWMIEGLLDHVRDEVRAWVVVIDQPEKVFEIIYLLRGEAMGVLNATEWDQFLRSVKSFSAVVDQCPLTRSDRIDRIGEGRSVLIDIIIKIPVSRTDIALRV
jgi:hypothetical protein